VKPSPGFPALLEAFFVDHLLSQRRASPHTVQSYRDTFRLLLAFTQQHLKKAPSALALNDLDTPAIGAFLDHIEKTVAILREREMPGSRRSTLSSIRRLQVPEHSAVIQGSWRCRARSTIARSSTSCPDRGRRTSRSSRHSHMVRQA